MLYLSIDLPLASKDDVINLINQHRNGLTLVIANKDGGTNALILDMPRSFPFQFGENSLEKHLLEAKSFGVETRVISIDGLSFDLDDIHDWNHLIATNKSLLNRLD
jgi:2-phospho-L-lactate guanylyltransferase (CobY/MobA/RfbA family)